MGLRIDIQSRLIALFKVNSYEIVEYDNDGLPSVGHGNETPGVECNETSASFAPAVGQSTKQNLLSWSFEIDCNFKNEVDFSDFLLSLDNLSYAYSDTLLVTITIGNNITVQHPVRAGGHTGTDLRFNITVNTKR